MEYRRLGRTGLRVSAIGLGTEHLEQRPATMDEVLAVAVEAGLTYMDLLYIDPKGDDAAFWEAFGPYLRARREGLVLAAHWGGGPRYDMEYCRRTFPEVLAQVGNGYAEIGLLTMVDDEDKWNTWAQESIGHLQRYQQEGRVGHIGLSSHVAPVARRAAPKSLSPLKTKAGFRAALTINPYEARHCLPKALAIIFCRLKKTSRSDSQRSL